jgi:hypothetical protein
VGLCLWDTFSDNHEVIAADGRLADIGSFRGPGAFIDEHLVRDRDDWRSGDYVCVVDCEAPFGVGAPSVGDMTEFGAVDVNALKEGNVEARRVCVRQPGLRLPMDRRRSVPS